MGIVISLPRAKSGTKASVVSTLITAILLTVMAIVFLLPIFGSGDLEVTQKFAARSSYDIYEGDYVVTVTGEVKNTTTETMYDVRFYVTVENEDYYADCPAITIDEILPGEIARVQGEFYGDGDAYDDIESIEYSINGGARHTLSQGDEWIASIGLGAVAVVMWIVFLISLAQYKKKKNQVQEQFGGNTFGGPVSTNDGHVVTNPFATNPQPTTQAPQAVQAQTCPYCGSKVAVTDGKCPGCGAKL